MANSSGAELSAPVLREAQHFRNYAFGGYRRADGLFDIEGRMTDTKSYAFPNDWRQHDRGRRAAARHADPPDAGRGVRDPRGRVRHRRRAVRDLPRHHAGLRRAEGRADRTRLVARPAREVRRPPRLRAPCRDAARDGHGRVPDALWLAGAAQARGGGQTRAKARRAANPRRGASRASSIPAMRWRATARSCARSTRSSTKRGSRCDWIDSALIAIMVTRLAPPLPSTSLAMGPSIKCSCDGRMDPGQGRDDG